MREPENFLETRALTRLGATLKGKYRLERLLGVGGMACVYEATHRNGKRFAVKVLHSEVSIDVDTRMRFLREGYVANKVDHPGAVAVLDDDVADDGAAFLVMELLEGAPVDALAARHERKLPLRVVLAIADQLLDVLTAADAKRIVHRDIKPSNIFLTRDGKLKVLDFGVARLREEAAGSFTTNTGIALGTPGFMAPEQALGRAAEIDGQSDLWAAGATMFTLLTGRAVHEAQSAQEQMVLAATKPSMSLGAADPTLPPSVVAIVDKALAFAKSDRWLDAAAMRDAVVAARAAIFAGETGSATLASMVSQVRISVAPSTSPSDPMAPTALAEAVSRRTSTGPLATSLVGTAARVAEARTSRARALRVLAASAVLVGMGALAGVMLTRRPTGVAEPAPGQAAMATSSSVASSSTPLSASLTTSSAPTASASTAAAIESSSARPRAVPPPPRPPAKSTATPHDSFDHQ